MPRQLSMDKVQQIIGQEATKKLLEEAPGTLIYVTDADKFSREARDAAIREAYYGNDQVTYDEVGEQFGLSGERIRQIVNRKHPA